MSRAVTLTPGKLIRHLYVVGASGSGVSDPHGDLVDEVLALLPEARHGDVFVIDPSDAEPPVGFNTSRPTRSWRRASWLRTSSRSSGGSPPRGATR